MMVEMMMTILLVINPDLRQVLDVITSHKIVYTCARTLNKMISLCHGRIELIVFTTQ